MLYKVDISNMVVYKHESFDSHCLTITNITTLL